MLKYLQNAGYFMVGSGVIMYETAKLGATYASAGIDTAIKLGKREMCSEPLHTHHDGCPRCDMP